MRVNDVNLKINEGKSQHGRRKRNKMGYKKYQHDKKTPVPITQQ